MTISVKTIAEQLLFTTVRIETTGPAGAGTGTGFIFNYQHRGEFYPLLITNKHVVSGATTGIIQIHQGSDAGLILGRVHRVTVAGFEDVFTGHPDPEIDVTLMPLAPILNHFVANHAGYFYRAVTRDIIMSRHQIGELDAIEEIVFVGYPNGIWDTTHFLPIIRRGTTATPIAIDFQGKRQFLVDGSVFPGSSGSPVFLYDKGMHGAGEDKTSAGGRLYFLGVIASVFYRQDLNEIALVPDNTADRPVAIGREMIDLGVVFKAETVLETVDRFLKDRGVPSEDQEVDIITVADDFGIGLRM